MLSVSLHTGYIQFFVNGTQSRAISRQSVLSPQNTEQVSLPVTSFCEKIIESREIWLFCLHFWLFTCNRCLLLNQRFGTTCRYHHQSVNDPITPWWWNPQAIPKYWLTARKRHGTYVILGRVRAKKKSCRKKQ